MKNVQISYYTEDAHSRTNAVAQALSDAGIRVTVADIRNMRADDDVWSTCRVCGQEMLIADHGDGTYYVEGIVQIEQDALVAVAEQEYHYIGGSSVDFGRGTEEEIEIIIGNVQPARISL